MRDLEKRRAKWRRYYKNHPDFHKQRRVDSQKKNADFVDQFKDKCIRCGNTDKRVLDFHHRDKDSKEQDVATLRVAGYSQDRILKEIQKCDVLCANCHRIVEWEERNELLEDRNCPH